MKVKKEKRNWGVIIFLIVIMIGTSFGFILNGFSPASDKKKYNGFTFSLEPRENIWTSKINGREAAFSFLPTEVENVPAPGDLQQRLQGRYEIDSTSDFSSRFNQSIALAQHQMGLTLGVYDIYVRKGFTKNSSFDLPIITCDGSTQNVPVIYFRQGNSTGISLNQSCIIAEAASNAEFIRVKDRLLYSALGVIR